MNLRAFIILATILIPGTGISQTADHQTTWMESPPQSELDAEHEQENLIGIFIRETYENFYNSEGELHSIHSSHRRMRLRNDEAINNFNKISVSLSDVVKVVEIKARVIKPDGRVIEFDETNIREVQDESSGKNFKIFAIDGIELGDDIEYLVVREMEANNFGRLFFQYSYPVQEAYFELISPKNLVYTAKGYNGFPDPVSEVLEDERNKISCTLNKIPGLKSLQYSYFDAQKARLEYKLEYNYSRGRAKVLTWNDAAQRVFEMMYQEVNPKTIDRWKKSLNIRGGSALSKAAQIEDYIKTNIYIQDYFVPEFEDLDFIRTKKVSSERGVVKLFANLLRAYDITHQLVLTTSREKIKFDPDFHSWNYLETYLIYLPDGDTYLEPANSALRMGYAEGELTATHGLFIEKVKIGAFESAIGRTRYITPLPYQANYDNMHIELTIYPEHDKIRIINTRGLKGLSGGYLGRIYHELDEERKQNLLKNLMETKAPDPSYESLAVIKNSDIEFLKDAEFLVRADFRTNAMMESAGEKLLVKVGDVIGPQVELYRDDERDSGGESDFNRWYYRRILLHIPEGYKIINPEAAVLSKSERSGDEVVFGFFSTYDYSGNLFTIDIDEYYREIHVEPEQFEGFRSVINAAADFNKVVLVLEKVTD